MHYILDQFQHISDSDERDHVEVSPESGTVIQKMSERIQDQGGRALIIDYGHDGTKTDTFRVTWRVYSGYIHLNSKTTNSSFCRNFDPARN